MIADARHAGAKNRKPNKIQPERPNFNRKEEDIRSFFGKNASSRGTEKRFRAFFSRCAFMLKKNGKNRETPVEKTHGKMYITFKKR